MIEQSLLEWPEPVEASTLQLNLRLPRGVNEEMIVVLPENLFHGLHSEQLGARLRFRKNFSAYMEEQETEDNRTTICSNPGVTSPIVEEAIMEYLVPKPEKQR